MADLANLRQQVDEIRAERDCIKKRLDTVGEAVFSVCLPERAIRFANHSVESIFGYKPEECINRTTEIFYANKDDYLDFGEKMNEAIKKDGDVMRSEHMLKRKNCEVFQSEITTTFLNRVKEVISVVRDISESARRNHEIHGLIEEVGKYAIEQERLAAAKKQLETEVAERKRIERDLMESKKRGRGCKQGKV